MNVRHRSVGVDYPPGGSARDPRWATAAVLGATAVATLLVTGSPHDVPVVVGTVLVALGIDPARLR